MLKLLAIAAALVTVHQVPAQASENTAVPDSNIVIAYAPTQSNTAAKSDRADLPAQFKSDRLDIMSVSMADDVPAIVIVRDATGSTTATRVPLILVSR